MISLLSSEVQGFLLLIDHRQEKLNIRVPGLKHATTTQLFLSSGIYDLKGRFSSLFGFGFLHYYYFFKLTFLNPLWALEDSAFENETP